MWYVVQVRTGAEKNAKRQCEKNIPGEVLERCFIPYYEEQRHVRGEWITLKRILFPGYIFVVTSNLKNLHDGLKTVVGLTKLLGSGHDIVPLTKAEICFVVRFGGEGLVVEMSEGIIEGSQVKVISGPLIGMEGYIRKIDRHKRKAWLEAEMFGRKQRIQVGLEIVMKR